jgi:diguanylate cyclase (GGDEF)-like protein/PAS domain S-box-containing protein
LPVDDFNSINPTRLARLFNAGAVPSSPANGSLIDTGVAGKAVVLVLRARDLIVVDVNDTFERVMGITRAQIFGRQPAELGIWQDQQQRRSVRAQLLDLKHVVSTEVSFHAANNGFGDGVLSVEPFSFGGEQFLLGIVQDVHLHDNASDALARPMSGYASFFKDSDQGLYRIWPKQRGLIEVNARFAELLGYESMQAVIDASRKEKFGHYAHPADFEASRALLFSTGVLPQRRVQFRRVDGALIWLTESARAVQNRDGGVLFIEGRLTDMSAIEQLQAVTDQLEERYRVVVENSREGVYIVQNGVIIFANPALARDLGYALEELLGVNYTETLVDPRDRAIMRARIALRAGGGVPSNDYEIRAVRKDGVSRLFEVRADALVLATGIAITGTMRDITDARASSEKLAHAEERFRKLFENAAVGMFQADCAGNLTEINVAMLRMFGFSSAEQMRGNLASVMGGFADAKQREFWRAAFELGEVVEGVETRLIHRDGHEFWVSMSIRSTPARPGRVALGEQEAVMMPMLIEGSMQDISARRLAELQLKFQANHDGLTRMPNRARFEAILGEYLERMRKWPVVNDDAHWVLLLDLDGFKVVNDSLGHAAGDELLVMICDRMLKELPDELVFSRYGGDEFAIVTRNPEPSHVSTEIAEALLGALSQPFLVRGHQIFASASIGISRMDSGYKDPQHVMRDADTAMYRAKALGKSRYEVFDAAMHRAAQDRLQLETDLRFALERGEFVTYYQPIVDLASGHIVGAEALTRWQHPTRGLLLPGAFLAVAEESGLLIGVDWYVIDQSCRQLAAWQKEFGVTAPGSVSVNISDRLFVSRGFSGSLADLIRSTGVEPGSIQLEITETVFRGNYAETLMILRELKAIGVRLLVDDFGTGYSSLVSFTQAAFDGLKIDRGFIEDLETNDRNRALVKTMCQFATDLSMTVVCEGVERFSQAEILLELGCVLGQGFRYAPALPPAAFGSRLRQAQELAVRASEQRSLL